MESLAEKYYKKLQAINEAAIDPIDLKIKFDNISGLLEANIFSGMSKKDHFGLELNFVSRQSDKVYEVPISKDTLALKPQSGNASEEEFEKYFDACRAEKSRVQAELLDKIRTAANEFDAKVLDILRQAGFERAE